MKRSKLSLENFKVKSFITSFDAQQSKTVKGGDLIQLSGSKTEETDPISEVRTKYHGCPQPTDDCPPQTVLRDCNTAANVCVTRIPCKTY